jgi:iron complex transport system substrate-binding protein
MRIQMMERKSINIALWIIATVLGIFNTACTHQAAQDTKTISTVIDSLVPKYSHAFRVDYYPGYRVLRVYAGKDKKTAATYLLCPKDMQAPEALKDAIRVNYPAMRVACMSTTHIGAMKLLDARNLIVAATNKDLICDSLVGAMINAGIIQDAGKDYQPDYEVIAQAKPDLLFTDGENTGASQMYAKMKALGVKVVGSRDYFEQEPLARAEWIRFFAAFIGKEKKADSIFRAVETDYKKALNEVVETENTPTVFCNMPYSGVWYMPCGENYVAKIIKDAGGDFLWDQDKPMNGLNLTLNFEQVYQRAAQADFWINTGTCASLKQLENADAKFKLFKAYKTGKVYNATKRLSAGGGMDIWETGSYTPNIVLHDLALILHQHDSLPGKLYYYSQLK